MLDLGPLEMKEPPNHNMNDVAILISDDEDEPPADPELEPEHVPNPPIVNVEDDDIEEVPDEEEDEEEEQVDDEEDNGEDEDENATSSGEKDDDSDDDSDVDGDKRQLNDSDDDDEDDEDSEDEDVGGTSKGRKDRNSARGTTSSRGKVMPGVSFPLSSQHEYKGDIEDLIRAAAQAEGGETSLGEEQPDGIESLMMLSVDHDPHEKAELSKKAVNDIECAVFDIIEGEEEIQEEEGSRLANFMKGSQVKDSHSIGDSENPPQKRMKNS